MASAPTLTEAPTVDVVDVDGAKVADRKLPPAWFSGEVNVAAMHQVVTAQLANARQGSAKTKTRGEARGGGRKPWRQKGTGRARHGSIRSPIWVGGGVAHGRRVEENHGQRVNKRTKRTALRSALTDRASSGDIAVVRGLAFEAPRTKAAVATLAALGLGGRKVLVVLGSLHQPTWRSFRNLPSVHLLTVDQLNTYDVLRSDVVVFDEAALDLIGTGQRAEQPTEFSQPAPAPGLDEEADDGHDIEPTGTTGDADLEGTEASDDVDEPDATASTTDEPDETGSTTDEPDETGSTTDEPDEDEAVDDAEDEEEQA
jgi:large subunit ribosomal protein L4